MKVHAIIVTTTPDRTFAEPLDDFDWPLGKTAEMASEYCDEQGWLIDDWQLSAKGTIIASGVTWVYNYETPYKIYFIQGKLPTGQELLATLQSYRS